jgi:hypothetical protein
MVSTAVTHPRQGRRRLLYEPGDSAGGRASRTSGSHGERLSWRGSSTGVDEGARQRRRTARAQDAGRHRSRGVPLVVSYGLERRGAGPDSRPSRPEGPAGRGGRHNPLSLRGRRHVTADPALPRTESSPTLLD